MERVTGAVLEILRESGVNVLNDDEDKPSNTIRRKINLIDIGVFMTPEDYGESIACLILHHLNDDDDAVHSPIWDVEITSPPDPDVLVEVMWSF